jgi:RHS repeat-associated protein
LLDYTHSYNDDDNLTARLDNLNSANDRGFDYDKAHRLTDASGPWGAGTSCTATSSTYEYDLNGNRTCKGEGASSTTYTYAAGSNQISTAMGTESATYSHDTAGNVTGDGTHTFGFDDAGRLASVDGGATATYTYDGEGRRVIKTAGGETTYFFYHPDGKLLTEMIPADEAGKDYIYFGDTPLARVDWAAQELSLGDVEVLAATASAPNVHLDWSAFPAGSNRYVVRRKQIVDFSDKTFDGNVVIATPQDPVQTFDDPVLGDANDYFYLVFRRVLSDTLYLYHADHLGTPIAMTDGAGALVWLAEHLPFGGIYTLPVSSVENNLRFPGQYLDSEAGLHQNVNRWYEPPTGRYTQADRFLPVTWEEPNPYAYARLRPTMLRDPLGLFAIQGSCDCGASTPFSPAENIPRAIARAAVYLRSPKCQQALSKYPAQLACLTRRFGPEEVGTGPHIVCRPNPTSGDAKEACGEFTYRFLDVPETIHLYPGVATCPRFNPSFGISQTIFHESIHSCGLEKHDNRFYEVEEACTGWK